MDEPPPFGVDAARLSRCIERLTPHVRMDRVAVTGGVAITLGLGTLGRPGARDGVRDLDFVAGSLEAVHASAVGPFLVSHYHVTGPGVPKFMIQLVDPVTRLRVDVFPDLAGSIADARTMSIGEHRIPVLPLERVFEHKLNTLRRASPAAPIDPKHMEDARTLGAALSRAVPQVAPEAVAPDIYGIETDGACRRCALSQDRRWPLAPKDQIFELLGWQRPHTPCSGHGPPPSSVASADAAGQGHDELKDEAAAGEREFAWTR